VKRLVRENGVETIELGIPSGMNRRKLVTLFRTIVVTAKQFKTKRIAVTFTETPELWKNVDDITPERISELAAENYEMADFEFTKFKTKPKEGWNAIEEIAVYGPWDASVTRGAKRGQTVGIEVNKARALANTPGGDMTPKGLAQAAKLAAKGLPITVTTLTVAQMQKLGMGALLGVGKGSLMHRHSPSCSTKVLPRHLSCSPEKALLSIQVVLT